MRRVRSARRVLVGEDNPVNRMVLLDQLGVLGYQSAAAEDGEEVLAALAGGSFDLVLMDCQMPGVDGYEATRRIRDSEGSHERLPIVALTAHATERDRRSSLEAGMDDYLVKPLKLDDLAATLDRWLLGTSAPEPRRNEASEQGEGEALAPASLERLRQLGRLTGRDILAPAAGKLLTEAELGIRALGHLSAEGNLSGCETVAHGLRGSGAALGALPFANVCGEIEAASRQGDVEALPALIETAAGALEHLRPELLALVEGGSGGRP